MLRGRTGARRRSKAGRLGNASPRVAIGGLVPSAGQRESHARDFAGPSSPSDPRCRLKHNRGEDQLTASRRIPAMPAAPAPTITTPSFFGCSFAAHVLGLLVLRRPTLHASSSGRRRSKFREMGVQLPHPYWATENSRARRRPTGSLFEAGKQSNQLEKGKFMQLVSRFNRCFHRSAAGGYLEVGPFDFDRDRPAAQSPFSHQAQTSSAIAITPASI